MVDFFVNNGSDLLLKTWEHLYISMIALFLGVIVAVPLGIVLTRFKRLSSFIIGLATILQTVPSLALLALMIPILGIGKIPAIVALFIYSLLPILRNTFIGVQGVDAGLKDAGKGMGMTDIDLIRLVELPQAAPVIMAGIRLSGVYVIAWAALASYIGAGGLGDFIFNGLNVFSTEFILAGTIPVTLMALIIDFLLGKLEEKVTLAQA
ncbi:osmoprotectant transport system permease protein [Carnobacterium iners]|uniref:Osmoprotectant transport system permease protein n=1 Tax=Carnobacterium iners TaxID=1073423 RepID=A0A1X7NMN2_9LACT|nr:ABC transporter permease [Carnobacterium iners]SEK82589.1 osmoprotectant transport system permease protein [Carnobacterium iners]SMH38322.1 osmoprotectant transport system permease protein [Carnobacterium iners]